MNLMEFTSAFFDEASAAWKMNKKRVGQMYVYRASSRVEAVEAVEAVPAKKVKHNYNLRSRSQNASVQRVYNTRASVYS
jgi:hypothetical protein